MQIFRHSFDWPITVKNVVYADGEARPALIEPGVHFVCKDDLGRKRGYEPVEGDPKNFLWGLPERSAPPTIDELKAMAFAEAKILVEKVTGGAVKARSTAKLFEGYTEWLGGQE